MRRAIIAGFAGGIGLCALTPAAGAQEVVLHETYYRAACSYDPDHDSDAIVRVPCNAVGLGVNDGSDIGIIFIAPNGKKVTFLGRGDLDANDGVFLVDTVEYRGRSIVGEGKCTIYHRPRLRKIECVATAGLKLYIGDAQVPKTIKKLRN